MQVKQRFNLLFYLKRKKQNPDGCPIYVRITIDGLRDEISINERVQPQDWDKKTKSVFPTANTHKELNDKINATRVDIKRHFEMLQLSKGIATPEAVKAAHIVPIKQLSTLKDGDLVKVSGLVLVRQRPGTASGVCFMTIEDETGWANLVVFQNLFDQYQKEILQSRLIMVEGKLQIEGEVIHVVVSACYNFSKLLKHLTASKKEQAALLTLPRGDEKPAFGKLFGEARNFK